MLWNGKDYWAHTPSEGSGGKPHDLRKHLLDTAERAQRYANVFGAGNLAYLLGLWHDLGKYNPEFQQYLRDAEQAEKDGVELGRKGPPHAIWGATLLLQQAQEETARETFVLPVLGHHAGLDNATEAEQKIGCEPDFQMRIGMMTDAIGRFGLRPVGNYEEPPTDKLRQELFTRMVTSALVDADFLDTERHFGDERPKAREHDLDIPQLWERFEAGRERGLAKQRDEGKIPAAHVQQVRDDVYAACLNAASRKPGVFRLTVPTGGGKTLSGLAFALKHAREHDLRRVIVAIPYTSIIDQNAKVYREVLGEDAVLEHHSAVQQKDNKQGEDANGAKAEGQNPHAMRLQLAAENWDVPLICTTFVQLFESLFARKTSKLRKLHRIARSVIVLDEVQTLPPDLRGPTLDVLRTLVNDYGVSLVFCTATQPAFDADVLTDSFRDVPHTEIVKHYDDHFQKLTRVEYTKHPLYPEPVCWTCLAKEIKTEPQILTILNTRKDALALMDALKKRKATDLYHLSTLMCGLHRKDVLDEINTRLDPKNPLPVRLVSTQVVEAGVDLDFPVVYRALAPLDRLIQAAGRCNRNGNSPQKGRVVIFQTESGKAPKGAYQKGIEKARTLIDLSRNLDQDMNGTAVIRTYFENWFQDVNPDELRIQPMRKALNFKEVAQTYKLIREETVSIVVPYKDYRDHLVKWKRSPNRHTWRALQPYIVSIYAHEAKKLLEIHMIEEIVQEGDTQAKANTSDSEGQGKAKDLEGKLFLFTREDKYDLITGLPVGRDPADLIYLEKNVF